MELIDFHAHLAPTEEALQTLLDSMARNEITQAVVVAGRVLTPTVLSQHLAVGGSENVTVDNVRIRELCDRVPGKLWPFFFANPFTGVGEYVREGHRFHGLKLAAIVHGIPLNDPRHLALVDVAQGRRHPIYLHCLPRAGFDLQAFRKLALAFPRASLVLGHGGVNTCDFYAVDTIRDLPNVYFETSGPFLSVIQYAAKTLGWDRLLFGTEHPLQSALVELTKMRESGIPFDVLNRNAQRLLGDANG